jgi:hypothetical protein
MTCPSSNCGFPSVVVQALFAGVLVVVGGIVGVVNCPIFGITSCSCVVVKLNEEIIKGDPSNHH